MREINVTKQVELTKEVSMLGDKDAAANIAVKDLATAKRFYAETLGLTPVGAEGQELIVFRSGIPRSTSINRATPEPIKPQP
jgi:hypothetical protein